MRAMDAGVLKRAQGLDFMGFCALFLYLVGLVGMMDLMGWVMAGGVAAYRAGLEEGAIQGWGKRFLKLDGRLGGQLDGQLDGQLGGQFSDCRKTQKGRFCHFLI